MMIEEFEKRTGFYPSFELYAVIEQAYMDYSGDKYAFCHAYKNNTDGLAEKIQRAATKKACDAQNENNAERTKLMEKIDRLTAQLEREQEWRPYEIAENVSQADYENLAQGAETGACSHYMTDDEAIAWICEEYDFNPNKITIVHEIDEHEINRHGQFRRTGRKIDRRPVYCATDYHYIRFNTSRWSYEVWNGQLRPFYD